jgi:hypothetical protein
LFSFVSFSCVLQSFVRSFLFLFYSVPSSFAALVLISFCMAIASFLTNADSGSMDKRPCNKRYFHWCNQNFMFRSLNGNCEMYK